MKIKKILLLILVATTLISADTEIKNFFVNGVGNTLPEARQTSKEIQKVTGLEMEEPLYNQTSDVPIIGELYDFLEAGGQSLRIDKLHEWITSMGLGNSFREVENEIVDTINQIEDENKRKVAYSVAEIIADVKVNNPLELDNLYLALKNPFEYHHKQMLLAYGLSENAINILGQFSETIELQVAKAVAESMKFMTNSLGALAYSETTASQDLDVMEATIRPILERGDKVNIIAHSQGNLFANKLLSERLRDVATTENAKLLSVATPDYRVFGFNSDDEGYAVRTTISPAFTIVKGIDISKGAYITLKEDYIATLFAMGYGKNYTNYGDVPDDLSNSPWYLKLNPLAWLLYSPVKLGTMFDLNVDKYGSGFNITGHSMIGCYLLEGSNSRAWIRYWYRENYKALGGELPEVAIPGTANVVMSNFTLDEVTQDGIYRMGIEFYYTGDVDLEDYGYLQPQMYYYIYASEYSTYEEFKNHFDESDFVASPLFRFRKKDDIVFLSNLIDLEEYQNSNKRYIYVVANVDFNGKAMTFPTETKKDDNYAKAVLPLEKENVAIAGPYIDNSSSDSFKITTIFSYEGNRDVENFYVYYYLSIYPTFELFKEHYGMDDGVRYVGYKAINAHGLTIKIVSKTISKSEVYNGVKTYVYTVSDLDLFGEDSVDDELSLEDNYGFRELIIPEQENISIANPVISRNGDNIDTTVRFDYNGVNDIGSVYLYYYISKYPTFSEFKAHYNIDGINFLGYKKVVVNDGKSIEVVKNGMNISGKTFNGVKNYLYIVTDLSFTGENAVEDEMFDNDNYLKIKL